MIRVSSLILAVLLLAGTQITVGQQPTAPLDALFARAQHKADVEGDLKGAIEDYRRVVERAGSDRALAARALLQMADAYDKLGDGESTRIYERLVRDYADLKDTVAIARSRVTAESRLSPAGIVTRQVWTGPKAGIFGAVSPDGRYVTGTDWETGDLLLHRLSDGIDRRLTSKGSWLESGEYAESSVFSPDGGEIVYSWFNADRKASGYDLRVVPVNTAVPPPPRVLYDNADVQWIAPYDWSRDGRWIAVQLHRRDRTVQIALVGASGSLRVLKSVGWQESTAMFFSPDSRYLAFDLPVDAGSAQRDVFVLAIDGSRERQAVVHAANDIVLGWTPDGSHLLFGSDRTGSMGLWALPVRDGTAAGDARLVKPDIGRPRAMGVTRSGALHFAVRTDGPDVYVASADFESGSVLRAPTRATQEFIGRNEHPDWSRDGRYLAYISRRAPVVGTALATSGVAAVVVVHDSATGQTRELRPKLTGRINYLRWAPDGRSLSVEGLDLQGRSGIFRVDAQTAAVSPLVDGQEPQWSPDGRHLFYRRSDGVVVRRDIEDGTEREVVRRGPPCRPDVSPDGRFLACVDYGYGASKQRRVWLFSVGGGEPQELLHVANASTAGNFAAWTPDSRAVLTWVPGDRPHLWLVSVSDRRTRRIDFGAGFERVSHVRIHPDGRQVAFVAGNDKSEVWSIDNFRSALTGRQ